MAASGHFRLLDLPRELRDMIYEYALTEKAGLVVLKSTPSRLRAADNPRGPDPNSLKFVCRQLYAETKGLGLRYNKLTFPSSFSYELFDKFTKKHCSPANFGRVGSVAILQTSSARLHMELQAADTISKRYPALSVEVRLDWLSGQHSLQAWHWEGSVAQCAIRGTFPVLASAELKDSAGRLAQYRSIPRDGFWADSTAVQVFPKSFDEEELRRTDPYSDIEDVDGWVAQCKQWFQEGF
ncbi:hypothetical protein J4E85_003732 [Alternaria conjuncta]|uniref:uncharacterized protein n=1 Tax=Alternaria conjuncta TaxID=181017 RepID=UPI00221E4E1A|nr:uncharacterized protein J4E85_003732 [Alternaria conjuncta]KAI4931143.1 hypothetical protein J4E85_003732 [Alternaria conjuncta]